jgi:hypothetical protein
METLGTKEGMEEFNYLRELNNDLAITDTNDFAGVMSTILPEGHPLHDITGSPEAAQEYLGDLRKMKDLGVLSPELEQFSKLMDADGDGKLDDTADIAGQIKDMVGEGINLSNFQGKDAKELMSMMDQGVVNIDKVVAEKNKGWADEQAAKKTQYEADTKKAISDTNKQFKDRFAGGDKSLGVLYDSFSGITDPKKADAAIRNALGKNAKNRGAVAKALGIEPPQISSTAGLSFSAAGSSDRDVKRKLAATKKKNEAQMKAFYKNVRTKMAELKSQETSKRIEAIDTAKRNIGYDAKATNPWENF